MGKAPETVVIVVFLLIS